MTGDPATLFAAADTLERAGRALDDTAGSVRGHVDLATGRWYGSAADAARVSLDRTCGYVDSYADGTAGAAPVVRAYAYALQAAQLAHASAEADAARATSDLTTASTARTSAQGHLDSFTTASDANAPGSTTAAEHRAEQEASLRSAVDAAGARVGAAQGALADAQAGMADAVAALARADAIACDALNALTGGLQALHDAILTSTPVPAGATAAVPAPPPARPTSHEEAKAPAGNWWDDVTGAVDGFMDEHDISWSDVGHTALDVAGVVPVVGEVADGANAVWYLAEGDYTNAAISGAAMVPGLGAAAIAGKYGVKGAKAVKGLVEAAPTAKVLDALTSTAGRAVAAVDDAWGRGLAATNNALSTLWNSVPGPAGLSLAGVPGRAGRLGGNGVMASTGSAGRSAPGAWTDPTPSHITTHDGVLVKAGQWLNRLRPTKGDPSADWFAYQQQVAGRHEFELAGATKPVVADGLHSNPDGTLGVLEAKFVDTPGRSMYEGSASWQRLNELTDMRTEVDRYREIILSPDSPVTSMRVITSTEEAARNLTTKMQQWVGSDIPWEVVLQELVR